MYKTLTASLMTVLLSSTAHANGMMGATLWSSNYGQALSPNTPHTDLLRDDSSNGFRLYGGAALNPNLSLHAGIMSLGSPAFSYRAPGTSSSAETSTKGFFTEARWQWRPGHAWRPYAKLGVALVNTELTTITSGVTPGPTITRETEASVTPVPGIGLVYETLSHWGVEIIAEQYMGVRTPDSSTENVTTLGAGLYLYW